MKRKTNRKQSWLVLAAMGVLVASYAYFFYLPGNREMADMKSQLAEAEMLAEGTVPMVAALGATQEELGVAVEYVQAWQESAPSEHELAELFERIHELTRLAETETTRFEPQSTVAYETFLRIPVSMQCEGTFSQLAAVLTGLENMCEPIWLKNVDIQATGQDGELATAEITLDIFADNLEDSDQENLSGKPITQEADRLEHPAVKVRHGLVSIVRRIKRETRNSPAKATLLAGLFGLALYSWAPLVVGWLGAGGESAETASILEDETDQQEHLASAPPVSENEIDSGERPSWHELQQWQQESPWSVPVELAHLRDPFRAVPGSEAVAETAETEEAAVTTPEQMVAGLNIRLTGTIVGPQRRVALLDGRAYREGDVVLVEHLGTTWELEIRRIEANRVQLGWQSIERELTTPERQRVGRIKLVEHSR